MSETFRVILMTSLALMVGEFIYRVVTTRSGLLPRAAAILGGGAIVYVLAPGSVDKMGGLDETASIFLCYAAMVFGMLAEHGYVRIEREEKVKLDATILLPILASPIVFIPLLTLTSEIGDGGAFTRAKLMVYLVAFQNGFFWKTFFEQQRKRPAPLAPTVSAGLG